MPLILFHKGNKFSIYLTSDAKVAFDDYGSVKERHLLNCFNSLLTRIEKYAELGVLQSPEQVNDEGDGFFAFKARCGLRAYWFYHHHVRGAIIVSHCIRKKKDALDDNDKSKMKSARDDCEDWRDD